MNLLLKRALRTIKSNIKSSIAIVIISLLSIMLFAGLSANYHYLYNDVHGMINDSNLADIYVTTKRNYKKDYVNLINDLNYDGTKNEVGYGIKRPEDIEERLYVDAYIKERKTYLTTYSDDQQISKPAKIIEGEDGVLINKAFAKGRGIDVGDKVSITVKAKPTDLVDLSESQLATIRKYLKPGKEDWFSTAQEITFDMTVTGIMEHGEALGGLASDVGMTCVNKSVLFASFIEIINKYYSLNMFYNLIILSALSNLDISNQFLIKGGNYYQIKKYFESKGDNNLIIATTKEELPGTFAAIEDAKQAKSLCYVFPVVFYISALLIIIASIDKLITDDRKSFGLMNAIGVGRKHIIIYYSLITVVQVLIGGLIGLILGPLVVPRIIGIKYSKLYSLSSHHHMFLYPESLIFFALLLAFCIFVTFIKCFVYLRQCPKDVMNNVKSQSHKFLGFKHILPKRAFSLKMALRNIFWNKTKSLLVIIGVMGCVALLGCGFGIEDTLNYGLKLELEEKLNYDIEVSFNHNKRSGADIAAMDSRITSYEEYSYSLVTLEHDENMVDTIMNIISDDTKAINIPITPGGATLSEKLAKILEVNVGDTIGIYSSGVRYDVKISNVTSLFFSQGIYLPRSAATMSYKNNRCILECSTDDLEEICDIITQDGEKSSVTGIYYAKTKQDRYNTANRYLTSLRIITGLINTFAILLCISVIYNLVSMNFKERIKDMASLKSLGYGYLTNAKALTYEITLLTFIGAVCGLFIALPFLKAVLSLNEPPLISFTYKINFMSYIYSLVLTLGVSAILNLLVSIKIKDIDMVSNLKERE